MFLHRGTRAISIAITVIIANIILIDMSDVYYFLHIPKTAGNSLLSVLKDCFANGETFLSYDEIPVSSNLKQQTKLILGGHWGEFGRLQVGIASKPIVLLREPIRRCVSEYNFIVQEHRKKSPTLTEEQVLIAESSFSDSIAERSYYYSDVNTRFLGGEFPYNDESWLSRSNEYRERVFQHAKSVVKNSLLAIVEHYEKSVYVIAQNFGILPNIDFNKRSNVTNIDYSTIVKDEDIAALKSVNSYDLKLYEFALEELENSVQKLGLVGRLSSMRHKLAEKSPLIPTIGDNYYYDFHAPLIADGLSYRESFSGRPGAWVSGTGALVIWVCLKNLVTRVFVRFHEALSLPRGVKVNGKSVEFSINIVSDKPAFQGFIVFDLKKENDEAHQVEMDFPQGITRSDDDPRFLSAIITQISFANADELPSLA